MAERLQDCEDSEWVEQPGGGWRELYTGTVIPTTEELDQLCGPLWRLFPDAEIKAVRDAEGDVWYRGRNGGWCEPVSGSYLPDLGVLDRTFGPLTEVADA